MRWRKWAAIGALAVAVGSVLGVAAVEQLAPAPCSPPRFLMERDRLAFRFAVDAHLERVLLAPGSPYKLKNPAVFDWDILDVQEQKPSRIRARVILGEEWTLFGPMTGSTFHLQAERKCANGDWHVTRLFEDKAGGSNAEPSAPSAG